MRSLMYLRSCIRYLFLSLVGNLSSVSEKTRDLVLISPERYKERHGVTDKYHKPYVKTFSIITFKYMGFVKNKDF